MTRSFFQTAIALVLLNTLVQLGWIIIVHNPSWIGYNSYILLLIIAVVVLIYTASSIFKAIYFYQLKHYVSLVISGIMILGYAVLLLTFYQIIKANVEPSFYLIVYYAHLGISAVYALSLVADKHKDKNLRRIGFLILLFSVSDFMVELALRESYPMLTQKLNIALGVVASLFIPIFWVLLFRGKMKETHQSNDQLLDTL